MAPKKTLTSIFLMIFVASCDTGQPKPISQMTLQEYRKSLGRKDVYSPYVSNESFQDAQSFKAAGGWKEEAYDPKKDPMIRDRRSSSASISEVLAVANTGLQMASAVKGHSTPQYRAPTSAASGGGISASSGPWYPFKQHWGPGKAGMIEIQGRYYDEVILNPGNGRLARGVRLSNPQPTN